MAGHFRGTAPQAKAFPSLPQFSGFMKPCRFEGELRFLEVEGDLPQELDGTFYRVMPDPQFAPFIENDPWFNGDGNITAFRFNNGNVHLQQKYVRTEKFQREREAQRALGGKYRNKYTDAVEFKIRTTANTNIFYFNKVLLAIKEDAPPYAMDPVTLETIGLWDFNGQLPSATFTAHPKLDPVTKELVCFAYEAKGDGTPDVCYYNIAPDGTFTETVWLVAPVVAMIHDFAVTENWVLFPIIPQTCDIDRLKQGGEHWQWDPDCPFYLGVLPRRGAKGSDVKWFKAPNAFPGHSTNAYETQDGKIVFDLPLTDKNVFFWWPDAQGNAPNPQDIQGKYVRFTMDPTSSDLDLPTPEIILEHDMEFPRIDERVSMKRHSHSYFDMMDPRLGTDFAAIMPVLGGGHPLYNSLGHLNHDTGKLEVYFPGKTHMVQEPVFVPRSDDAPEGDGFLMGLVNNYSTQSSELHIIDSRDFTVARAIVKLNIRLRAGLHGNWVDAKELES
ncbi:carotenoid oxygenase [Dactylonectria estremocensis]|uniref:Carotenoid oxygenase n=1 Tax=Dactylonectria estremocensis TaxID=1079267 RepID=A0A9P9JD22_9HYPO|nr:carotenoid oxygenase [Dactylonectria estremocensis]